jgi:hypothetical protein
MVRAVFFGGLLGLAVVVVHPFPALGAIPALVCNNPGHQIFRKDPPISAPDATRAIGVLIRGDKGTGERIPDRRPSCLPLALRLNNPGAQKAVHAPGQIGRDPRGHAVFDTVESGIAEVIAWIERRRVEHNDTAFLMMSRYAPPDDCLGSVGKIRSPLTGNLECPPKYPLNPTREYAVSVAAAVGKGPNDHLALGRTKCPDERKAVKTFIDQIITFESGGGFCAQLCIVDAQVFDRAIVRAWGESPSDCSPR